MKNNNNNYNYYYFFLNDTLRHCEFYISQVKLRREK